MENKAIFYAAPAIEELAVEVEQGFAMSPQIEGSVDGSTEDF